MTPGCQYHVDLSDSILPSQDTSPPNRQQPGHAHDAFISPRACPECVATTKADTGIQHGRSQIHSQTIRGGPDGRDYGGGGSRRGEDPTTDSRWSEEEKEDPCKGLKAGGGEDMSYYNALHVTQLE